MMQSIVLFIFALFCLYKSSIAGVSPAGFSGDAGDAYLDDIVCGVDGESTSFDISIPDINRWGGGMGDAEDWQLVIPNDGRDETLCRPTFSGMVRYGPFTAQECAKEINIDELNFIMEAVFEVNVGTSGVVTFQYDHHYLITCRYSTIDEFLEASFLPLHSVSNVGSGYNDLTFNFYLYFSNNVLLTTSYVIDLESALYGELTVDGAGVGALDVHFLQLYAYVDEETYWPLIWNGCSEDDNIITGLTCDDDKNEVVDFLAFRFTGQADVSLVTFYVVATVCLPDEPNNQCDQGCASCGSDFRKRRSLDVKRAVETTYYLQVGPFKFGNVDKRNQKDADDVDKSESSTFPTYLIAILVVSGVAAIAIVSAAVVIVFRKRRRNATLTESSETSESSTGVV